MDPQACYERWLQAVQDGDKDEAWDASRDLRDWIAGGGFEPEWTPADRRAFYAPTCAPVSCGLCGKPWHGPGRCPHCFPAPN